MTVYKHDDVIKMMDTFHTSILNRDLCMAKLTPIELPQQEISDDDYPELEGTMELCNDKVWDDIYEEYSMEQYPAFGGPFTDSISFIDWLKLYYKAPEKK